MVNHLILFQKHAHISPRQQELPANKSFSVTQNDPLTKKSGQIKFSLACEQVKGKERGKRELTGMAKDFNFQMTVIYFMFTLTIWIASTTTANFKSITHL